MILCAYGCGNVAIYFNRQQVGRCSFRPSVCEGIRARAKQSIKNRYASKTEEEKQLIKNRRLATNIKKYGVANVSSVESVKLKKEQTFLDKFGTTNPSQNTDIRAKIKDKMPVVLKKRKKTNLDRYGVEHYSSTEEFKSRRKITWTKRYGADNPSKNNNIKDKIMKGQDHRRTNKIIILNGQIVRVQGYEDQVIRDLIKSGISESEIICDRDRIPKISYTIDNKVRTYYPDIYLPRYNILIEVKSLYTWKKYKAINIAKISSAKHAGYNVRVAIR